MLTKTKITRLSTMQEILEAYPSAQRALFRQFHIGGCNKCGYHPEDTLEKVAYSHEIIELDELIKFIEHSEQTDQRIQISPTEVAKALQRKPSPSLIDVRTREEWELARIKGAILNTEELAQQMMRWPKDVFIVFYCHFGQRSLDAASYFAGHGFSNVRSMTGGIDAWSLFVDPSIPRYETTLSDEKTLLQPLRTIVSKAVGCQNQEGRQ